MNRTGSSSSNAAMSPINHRQPRHSRVGSRDTSSEGGTTTTSKRIPSDQWEAKRAIITQLYQEEKRPLKEVMDILEMHYGFTATVKMFKSRIWKWGLDKKLKSDEVLAIMVLRQGRGAANRDSEFTIRGQPVDMENINRYIKRNPQLVTRFNAGELPSKHTMDQIDCRTPSPAPSPNLAASPSRPATDVLASMKEFIEDSLQTGAWKWQYDVSCTSAMVLDDPSEDLFERMLMCLALINKCLARGDVISVGAMLEPAFGALEDLMVLQSPIFAARMIALLWYLEFHHKHDLLQVVMDKLDSLATKLLGPQHLMAQVWRSLARDLTNDFQPICEAAYVTLVPLFESRVGPANLVTTMLHGDHIDFLYHMGRTEEALAMSIEYERRVSASSQQHPWTGEVAQMHSLVVHSRNATDSGIPSAMALPSEGISSSSPEEQQAILHLRLGNHDMQANQPGSAMTQYKQALQILESTHGDERLFLAVLANLEASHKRLDEHEEAESVRNIRNQRQEMFVNDTRQRTLHQHGQMRSESRNSSGNSNTQRFGAATLMTPVTPAQEFAKKGHVASDGLMPWAVSPATSTGDQSWTWSPEMLRSPQSGTLPGHDWQFPL